MLSPIVFSHSALAGPFDYGNFSGTDVDYLQVTESSTTNTNALYGEPTVTDNSISFDPVSFGASGSNGSSETTQGDLMTTLSADNGVFIHALEFGESGDYTLEGTGTAATNVSVTAPVTITITEINDSPITPIVANESMTFVPAASFALPGGEGAGQIYTGSLDVDLDTLIADADDTGSATEVEWLLDNTLTANSETGTVALIAKKEFDGVAITPELMVMNVPEPVSTGLLTVGLTTLLLRRRRSPAV